MYLGDGRGAASETEPLRVGVLEEGSAIVAASWGLAVEETAAEHASHETTRQVLLLAELKHALDVEVL